jgi:toxin ParE1/3/4
VSDDLANIVEHLSQGSDDAAGRFVDAVELTLKDLAAHPGHGSPKLFSDPELRSVRSWWIAGFKSYLIFYRPIVDGIEALAIFHGARDAESVLRGRV